MSFDYNRGAGRYRRPEHADHDTVLRPRRGASALITTLTGALRRGAAAR